MGKIIAILALVAFICLGLFVWHKQQDKDNKVETKTTEQKRQVEKGWKEIETKWFTFNIPSAWKVEKFEQEINKGDTTGPSFLSLSFTSPDFASSGQEEFFKMEGMSLSVVGFDLVTEETNTPGSKIIRTTEELWNYYPIETRNKYFFLEKLGENKFVIHDKGTGYGKFVTGWDGTTYKNSLTYDFRLVLPNDRKEEGRKLHRKILSSVNFKDSLTPKGEGDFCGGFGGIRCPTGFNCQLENNYPDAGGICAKN